MPREAWLHFPQIEGGNWNSRYRTLFHGWKKLCLTKIMLQILSTCSNSQADNSRWIFQLQKNLNPKYRYKNLIGPSAWHTRHASLKQYMTMMVVFCTYEAAFPAGPKDGFSCRSPLPVPVPCVGSLVPSSSRLVAEPTMSDWPALRDRLAVTCLLIIWPVYHLRHQHNVSMIRIWKRRCKNFGRVIVKSECQWWDEL